jgi:methionine-rich copper-binding protein CopC
MPKRFVSLAIALLSLLATAMRADGHAFVVRAEPRVGSKIKKAPNQVRVWFSEPVQPSLSSIKVVDASGKQVDKKDTHLDQDNRALLDVSVGSSLAPGTYRVIWRVTSVDTHVTSGDFRFQIVP